MEKASERDTLIDEPAADKALHGICATPAETLRADGAPHRRIGARGRGAAVLPQIRSRHLILGLKSYC